MLAEDEARRTARRRRDEEVSSLPLWSRSQYCSVTSCSEEAEEERSAASESDIIDEGLSV